jgi:hypothetical protein
VASGPPLTTPPSMDEQRNGTAPPMGKSIVEEGKLSCLILSLLYNTKSCRVLQQLIPIPLNQTYRDRKLLE